LLQRLEEEEAAAQKQKLTSAVEGVGKGVADVGKGEI
jgi:hypothetical protein